MLGAWGVRWPSRQALPPWSWAWFPGCPPCLASGFQRLPSHSPFRYTFPTRSWSLLDSPLALVAGEGCCIRFAGLPFAVANSCGGHQVGRKLSDRGHPARHTEGVPIKCSVVGRMAHLSSSHTCWGTLDHYLFLLVRSFSSLSGRFLKIGSCQARVLECLLPNKSRGSGHSVGYRAQHIL